MDAFLALALPRRRKIVELLARSGRLTATRISSEFDVTAQAISQHLKVLLDADILEVERKGQMRLYYLNPNSISELGEWALHIQELWKARLGRLDEVLKESDSNQKK